MKINSTTPLGENSGWFFECYNLIVHNDEDITQRLIQKAQQKKSENEILGVALSLYLMALSARQHGDSTQLNNDFTHNLCDICHTALNELMTVKNHSETLSLAILYGALNAVNLMLKRAEIAQTIGQVKNFVYKNCISGGSLTSSSSRDQLTYDLLLACTPFGLFEPEDLVLVSAIEKLTQAKKLESTSDDELALLAWYYAEQGSYQTARNLLHGLNIPIAKIASQRLQAMNQLATMFIKHKPMGNGNRYEPMVEERFPKLVTSEDEVVIRALSVPFSADEPLELQLKTQVIKGEMLNGHWQFIIPANEAGQIVEYQLQFKNKPDVKTKTYSYEILQKHVFGEVSAVFASCHQLIVSSNQMALKFELVDGQMTIAVQQLADNLPPKIDGKTQYNLGEFVINLSSNPFAFSVSKADYMNFESAENGLKWFANQQGDVEQIILSLQTQNTGIYGLGERYNALDQSGQFVDQYVYNQYKDQGLKTYIPMPVFYTKTGYGMHIDSYSYTWFDFASAQSDLLMMGIESNILSIQVFEGSLNDQIAQFMARTGEVKPVPTWALGPWMSSNNWDSDAEVRKQVELTKFHNIPATVLVIEAWSDEATFYIFNDATYDEVDGNESLKYSDFKFPQWGRWPDPKGLVEHLHDNDLKVILWQIPIVKQVTSLTHLQKTADEAALIDNGYGVKNADGSPYRLPEGWFKDSLLLDFTNDDAKKWWFDKRQYLIDDLAVDGFKTDGGECVFGNDLTFADGSDGLTMRNKYPVDYISAYYEFAQQNNGITFSRSGYTGAQTFPAHWAGDERSTWDAFKRSILAGLSSGMSGVVFWGWDLGGFSGPVPTAELYIRSVQMACFCPIMQFHAESKAEYNQDRTPWNIAERSDDKRALDIYRYYANLRMSLMPYLRQEAAYCVSQRTPMMRALVLDYQQDPQVSEMWDEYMFGRDLLVAPVINQNNVERQVYLPQGKWWHLFENKYYDPGWQNISASLAEIPIFAKYGSLIPLTFDDEIKLGASMPSDIDKPNKLVLLIVGKIAKTQIFTADNGVEVYVVMNSQGHVKVNYSGELDKQFILTFTETPIEVHVNNQQINPVFIDLAGRPLYAIYI
ncbi:MAG: hypothetical protein HRU29_14400 [Rhizobiales bacterium]|nr:hypothetical protein [Hyphomicrobiales bacterium]NRB15585.1 hypothetical protein [Hyphomicrobiales bacterium]